MCNEVSYQDYLLVICKYIVILWLANLFFGNYLQRRNVSELMRVYLHYDMIEEAVDLSTEYLYALTSHTYESFGLEVCFNNSTRSIYKIELNV